MMTPDKAISRRALLSRGASAGAGIVMAFSLPLSACGEAGQPSDPASSPPGSLIGSLADNPALSSWIKIHGDDRVSLFTGKAELGQGILTALVQIAADALEITPDHVDIISADTANTPNEGFTSGSLSIEKSGMAIRQVATELRALLLELASAHLKTPIETLRVKDGLITGAGGSISYWTLAQQSPFITRAEGRAKGHPTPLNPARRAICGTSMPRIDLEDKVFGHPSFIQDIRLDGMLHARIISPPSLNARLIEHDPAVLDGWKGIEAIIHDGSFLALVARQEYQAVKAAAALKESCRWTRPDPLPAIEDLDQFILDHPLAQAHDITPQRLARNLMATDGLKSAAQHQARYSRPFQAHASLAPSCALARMNKGVLTIWSHTQGVFPLRAGLAEVLAMPQESIHVIHAEGAGCYGQNAADDAALDAALICRAIGGKPVRLQYMRDDEFLREPYGAAMVMTLSARIDDQTQNGGQITGKIGDWRFDVHGFPHSTRTGPGRGGNLLSAQMIGNPIPAPPPYNTPQPRGGLGRNAVPLYDFAGARITEHFIPQSPLRVGALRGLGAYANVFAIESFIDELAHLANLDPLALRLQHLQDARARTVITRCAELAGWSAKRPGKGYGMGFARYKNFGGYLACSAIIDVDPESGAIAVEHIYAAVDCGEVINPDGLRNQIEGGLMQSMSWTLSEAIDFKNDQVMSRDWASYPILGFETIPTIEIALIDRPDSPPLGAGEVAQGPMAAALANAIMDKSGVRLRALPLTAEKLKNAMARRPNVNR